MLEEFKLLIYMRKGNDEANVIPNPSRLKLSASWLPLTKHVNLKYLSIYYVCNLFLPGQGVPFLLLWFS